MRRLAILLVAWALVAACGGDGGRDEERAAETTTTTVRPTTARELREVDLVPGLVKMRDFPDPEQTEGVLVGGDFSGVGEGQRITICGEDIRADLNAVQGRFSQFRVDLYAVVNTVTALPEPQASALVQRFDDAAGSCEQSWTQPDPNGGRITREVRGGFPLEDIGVEAVAYVLRGRNQLGEDDAVVILARQGPFVSSLTVTGPVGNRFQIVRPLSHAVGRRLLALDVG